MPQLDAGPLRLDYNTGFGGLVRPDTEADGAKPPLLGCGRGDLIHGASGCPANGFLANPGPDSPEDASIARDPVGRIVKSATTRAQWTRQEFSCTEKSLGRPAVVTSSEEGSRR